MKAIFHFNSTGAQFYLGKPGALVVAADNAAGPFVFEGADLAAITRDNHIGVSPSEAARRREVPATVEMWRVRAVLSTQGKTAAVEAAIAAMPQPAQTVVSTAWNYGNIIERNSPTIAGLASVLKMTAAQVDALFIAASAIAV